MNDRIAGEKRAHEYLTNLGWVMDDGGYTHEMLKGVSYGFGSNARLTLREALILDVGIRYGRERRISDLIKYRPTKD
jgi:hypothetical protein